MDRLHDITTMWELAGDYLRYAVRPRNLQQSMASLRCQLAARDQSLLDWVERLVYGNPRSPYRALLAEAGCQMGDVRRLVQDEGVEGALRQLERSGVYLTYEEMKGRQEVVRGSRRFLFTEADFDNPATRGHIVASTGGSSGRPVTSSVDIGFISYQGMSIAATYAAHGLERPVNALWLGVPPEHNGVQELLFQTATGFPIAQRWFSPIPVRRGPAPPIAALGLRGLRLMGRLAGYRYPVPEYVPLEEARVVARWLAEASRRNPPGLLITYVSPALEVVKAAKQEGLDISNTVMRFGAEALTPARAAAVTSLGNRVINCYGASEIGKLGMSCPEAPLADDVHLFTDVVALITHQRQVNASTLEPWLFTSLHPQARKLLLNVEIGDCGTISHRECGCLLERLGFTTHLSGIQSFGKLTAQGRNILGSDMARIVEEVLPRRFGGSPVDYQLQEEETADGVLRLTLAISPEAGDMDPNDVIATVLAELRKDRPSYRGAADLWERAGTLRVERRRPVAITRGKVLPLYFASRRESAMQEAVPGEML